MYCDETEFVTELKDWESAITKAAIEEIEKRIRGNAGRVRSEVKAIVAEAIANSPEIQALLNDEDLIGSFGFYGGSAEQQARNNQISNGDNGVIVSPYRSKANQLLTVNVQPKHLEFTRVTRGNHQNQRLRSELVGMVVDQRRYDCGRWLDV